jgi:hypothetical protein
VSGLPVGGEIGASSDLASSLAAASYFAKSAFAAAASALAFLTSSPFFIDFT